MEFRRININEDFFIQTYRFRKINEKQAEMYLTGKVKDIYAELPVEPAETDNTKETKQTK